MSEELKHEDFLGQLNSTFRLPIAGRDPIELQLCAVSDLTRLPKQEVFSIEFLGPNGLMLPQQTYRMEHEVLGEVELMFTPIRSDASGIYYEAVFNRLTD